MHRSEVINFYLNLTSFQLLILNKENLYWKLKFNRYIARIFSIDAKYSSLEQREQFEFTTKTFSWAIKTPSS